jgi:DNA-directed RNA polymerase specialized sigma24 family protein
MAVAGGDGAVMRVATVSPSGTAVVETVGDVADPGCADAPQAGPDPDVDADRCAADKELVDHLATCGFAGPGYDRFAGELAKYAVAVLCGWMHSGYVFRLLAGRGFALGPTERELEAFSRDADLRQELAVMVAAVALRRFRDRALVGGGWRADGGASLTTYFMGACLAVFPGEFRRHRAESGRWRAQDAADARHAARQFDAAADPADVVLGELRVREDLARMDSRTRAIVALRIDGYRQEEIAEMLGERSVRAVEGVLYRWRVRENRHVPGGGE